jgi:hypothetical protein
VLAHNVDRGIAEIGELLGLNDKRFLDAEKKGKAISIGIGVDVLPQLPLSRFTCRLARLQPEVGDGA